MTTAAILAQRRPTGMIVLPMTGPVDPRVRRCIFCAQVFETDESWLKIGFPRAGYIGAHDRCSARKDAEVTQQRQQH
jgi:hypothetical protein